MQFFSAQRIASLSTDVLLDQLVDFGKQQAKTTRPELRARNADVIAMFKAELAGRAAK